jgi:hypothetical protein
VQDWLIYMLRQTLKTHLFLQVDKKVIISEVGILLKLNSPYVVSAKDFVLSLF